MYLQKNSSLHNGLPSNRLGDRIGIHTGDHYHYLLLLL